MSFIPDCREDEVYNQKYLLDDDSKVIKGYDECTEQIDSLFANLEIYKDEFDIEGEDINLVRFFSNHPTVESMLKGCIKDYFEAYRDELITAMIENMDEDVYEKRKAEVDSGNISGT